VQVRPAHGGGVPGGWGGVARAAGGDKFPRVAPGAICLSGADVGSGCRSVFRERSVQSIDCWFGLAAWSCLFALRADFCLWDLRTGEGGIGCTATVSGCSRLGRHKVAEYVGGRRDSDWAYWLFASLVRHALAHAERREGGEGHSDDALRRVSKFSSRRGQV
jgi:hypothetical protein